jgi:hypothetical protein
MWRELLFGVEHGALVRTGWIMHGGVPPPYYYNYNDYGGLMEKVEGLRLPALMDLYIHLLYILVSKILFYILNSPAPIHSLYHPLSTLSTVGPTYRFI